MSELVEKLADAVAARDYGAVDDLWLELLEAETLPVDELAPLLERLAAAGEGARAMDLVLALVPELIRDGRHAEALPLLRAVALTATPSEDVRAALIDCYRRVHRRKRHAAACIDRSGILNNPDIGAAVRRLERMLCYEEGDYVYHPSGWGVGQITGFHPLEATAIIDFEHKLNHAVPLETLETIFERLEPSDFRVLCRTDLGGLETLAQEDPPALIHKVLAANGGRVTLRGLREQLQGTVVPADGWTRWWTRARAALRRDALVEMTAGSNPVLTLRAEALTYEDEMRAQFDRMVDLAHKTELVREYHRHRARDAAPEAFLLPACRELAEQVRGGAPAGERFEAAVLLTRLKADAGEFPTPQAILGEQADPIHLLNGLTTEPARRHAIELLRRQTDRWKQTCHEILLRGPAELWDAALAGLAESPEPPTVQTVVDELRAEPQRNLDLLAWLGRGLLSGRIEAAVDAKTVFELLLTEGDVVARRKALMRPRDGSFDQAGTLSNFRQALRTGGLDYFDAILADTNETDASRLLFRIRQSRVLTEQAAYLLERKIIRRFPKLLADEQKEAAASGPDYIYATPAGIARRRDEHDRLVNEELPEIERRIGEAAAMGDISDNADWRTAIEERTHLTRRIREMVDELARARPIEPSMVHSEHVSIGSRVTLENAETGERATYDILGVWDSDSEHNIMSYTAPLARALMRHKVGEEIPFAHAGEAATYRIVAIGNALAARQETPDA